MDRDLQRCGFVSHATQRQQLSRSRTDEAFAHSTKRHKQPGRLIGIKKESVGMQRARHADGSVGCGRRRFELLP